MPWSAKDAKSHTKKADTPKKKEAWSKAADAVLAQGGSERAAVRIANSVVKKATKKK